MYFQGFEGLAVFGHPAWMQKGLGVRIRLALL